MATCYQYNKQFASENEAYLHAKGEHLQKEFIACKIPPSKKAVQCPNCGSANKKSAQMKGKIEFSAQDTDKNILHFYAEKKFFECMDDEIFTDVMSAAEILMDYTFKVSFDKKT